MADPSLRRRWLKAAGAAALASLARPVAPASRGTVDPAADLCTAPAGRLRPLLVPGERGPLGRIALAGRPLALRAAPSGALPAGFVHGPLACHAEAGGKRFLNPTLVLQQGERVRIELANALAEPTILHWHGLTVDERNDGAGRVLVAPGARYAYDFEVRNRAGLYWYHPHPHGATARQAYDGLYGLLVVEDDDERALRAALGLVPGRTEIPLVLQDRRAGPAYAPSPADTLSGFLGDAMTVNGTPGCARLDVATRPYRFRILNACNARTLRLAFRDRAGARVPFLLLGTDGGLLREPVACTEAFLASAERLDVLLDLRAAAVGDGVVLQTLAFDPMPFRSAGGDAGPPPEDAHGRPSDARTGGGNEPRSPAWHEGEPRDLLDLPVTRRERGDFQVPATLARRDPLDPADARTRSFRLGYAKGRWRINDRVFAMDETPIEVERGSTEVWLVRNYHASMPHAMHLHAFAFQVLERETSPDAVAALAVDDRGRLATDLGHKDTVLVWPGESVRLAVRFELPFPGPQRYLFHCHNLEHEDAGMMLGVLVA